MHNEERFRAHARAADPHHEAVVRASATRSKPIIAIPVPTEDEAETDRQRWLAWLGQKTNAATGMATNLDGGQDAVRREVYGVPDLAEQIVALRKSLEQSDAAIRFLLEPVEPDDIHNFP